ncbi:hypothetical protein BpHYR1_036040 [Brachionus plicatilis]|uniref:Uncharacterized protein n=1 Tax=Brachionus plicatilis TaxID=10195 RepID=A0A3M7RYX1_BRAPC|nr:hypothetical protein BpHYR1_036040 [Brachionus plicatilis]
MQGVPLVNDSFGEEVNSLLTFGRDLARKSSPVSPNITSWSCLRERAAVFHRFHPAYSVDSAVEFEHSLKTSKIYLDDSFSPDKEEDAIDANQLLNIST